MATERLHVHDVTGSMGQTEAFRLMMKEKEALIAERYKLNDTVNQLRRQATAAENKWDAERSALEKVAEEKTKALEEVKNTRDRLQKDLARIKVRLVYAVMKCNVT